MASNTMTATSPNSVIRGFLTLMEPLKPGGNGPKSFSSSVFAQHLAAFTHEDRAPGEIASPHTRIGGQRVHELLGECGERLGRAECLELRPHRA